MLLKLIENLRDSIENNEDLHNIEFLSREYLEMHKLKCDKCQKFRVECAFSPHCTDRRHLNILIEINTSKDERYFPTYCYSLFVKNVNDFLNNKDTLTSPNDSWIYLEDFLNLFKKELGKTKEIDHRELFNKLLSIWKKDEIPLILEKNYEHKDDFTFLLKGRIFRISFPKTIIIVDVHKRVCHSDEELERYLEILSQMFNLTSMFELVKDTNTLWYLKFKSKTLNKKEIEEHLSKITENHNIFEADNKINVMIDLKTSVNKYSYRKNQNYKNLRKIFKLISENI